MKKYFTKHLAKRAVKTAITLISALLCLLALSGCDGSQHYNIDLADYGGVYFSGYDGYGTAKESNGSQDLILIDMTGGKQENKAKYLKFIESIKYTADKTEGLKNGDTVKLTATYDTEAAKLLNFKVTGLEQTFTVEGLEEAEIVKFDEILAYHFINVAPFARLRIGYAPETSPYDWKPNSLDSRHLDCEINGEIYPSSEIHGRQDFFFKNGDEITFLINEEGKNKLLEKGLVVDNEKLTVTISGIAEYLTPETATQEAKKLFEEAAVEYTKDKSEWDKQDKYNLSYKPYSAATANSSYIWVMKDLSKLEESVGTAYNKDTTSYYNIIYVIMDYTDSKYGNTGYVISWYSYPHIKPDNHYTYATKGVLGTCENLSEFDDYIAKHGGNFTVKKL